MDTHSVMTLVTVLNKLILIPYSWGKLATTPLYMHSADTAVF